jgi:hypothetical protein
VDILDARNMAEKPLKKLRMKVHVGVSAVLAIIIIIFNAVNDESVISALFTIAGYTYGPLLGMYSFGLFTKWKVKDKWIPLVAVISPVLCYFLSYFSEDLFNGYKIGFELLIINGILTFAGLWLLRKQNEKIEHQ